MIQIVRSSYKVSLDWIDQTIGNNRVLKNQHGGRSSRSAKVNRMSCFGAVCFPLQF